MSKEKEIIISNVANNKKAEKAKEFFLYQKQNLKLKKIIGVADNNKLTRITSAR